MAGRSPQALGAKGKGQGRLGAKGQGRNDSRARRLAAASSLVHGPEDAESCARQAGTSQHHVLRRVRLSSTHAAELRRARGVAALLAVWGREAANPVHVTACEQSMKWTGPVRRIQNPIQSKWIWTGLDYKITCSTDSGLDWIGNLPFPYFILEYKLLLSQNI